MGRKRWPRTFRVAVRNKLSKQMAVPYEVCKTLQEKIIREMTEEEKQYYRKQAKRAFGISWGAKGNPLEACTG